MFSPNQISIADVWSNVDFKGIIKLSVARAF